MLVYNFYISPYDINFIILNHLFLLENRIVAYVSYRLVECMGDRCQFVDINIKRRFHVGTVM